MNLFSMESSFPAANSVLRFLESHDTCRKTLWERLFAGTYDKPFIVDSGRYRFLHFDLDAVQSAMELDDPEQLSLTYTRKMMTFLLFNSQPSRILLLGLGGGSLAKFCYRRLPHTALTAVEGNPDVIALRGEFQVPPDNGRFRIYCDDGARYVARLGLIKDMILADACDRTGVAPALGTLEFYQHAYRGLSSRGVFVGNLCGDTDCAAHLTKIRTIFADNVVTLPIAPDGNIIVFAFKGPRPDVSGDSVLAHALRLSRRFRLDFARYVQRLSPHFTNP